MEAAISGYLGEHSFQHQLDTYRRSFG